MRKFRSALLIVTGLLGITGCVNPQQTRIPTLAAGDPRMERANYRYFDPYPERESGPLTYSRPRGFDISRTEARSSQERAFGGSAPVTPTTWNHDRVGKYRDVVRE